jgi:hypothetical protein
MNKLKAGGLAVALGLVLGASLVSGDTVKSEKPSKTYKVAYSTVTETGIVCKDGSVPTVTQFHTMIVLSCTAESAQIQEEAPDAQDLYY